MPWPEKTLPSRILAGVAGAFVGAIIAFIAGLAYAWWSELSGWGHVPLLSVVLATAFVSFATCFWIGDSAVRFLLRVLGEGRVR